MKRTLLTGGIGAAVLALAIPAGAIIQNQVSRPSTSDAPVGVAVDEPATTVVEPPTTVAETPKPHATEPAPTVTEPSTTVTEHKPEPVRTEPKPEFVIRLECAAKVADTAIMNVCHWTEPTVAGAGHYKVWRIVVGSESRQVIGSTDGREWVDRDVKPGMKYAYAVEALGDAGSVGFSNTVTIEDPQLPAVFKLWCSPKLTGTTWAVVCEWSALNRDGVKSYQLWRKVGDGTRELIATLPATANRRNVDVNVQPGQGITYVVVAINGDGATMQSSDPVHVVIPTELPTTTTAKPVESPTTTAPKATEPTVTTAPK
jgi:hypothetical protein